MMAAPRNEKEYIWLSDEVIEDIERQLNPAGLAYGRPGSWSCQILEAALKKAYRAKFPSAASEPQYKGRAHEIVSAELDKILEKRLKSMGDPLDRWEDANARDEPFSSAVVVNSIGRLPQPSCQKHDSPPVTTLDTLPSQSRSTIASSSTSVSTGRDTCTTLNGNNGGSLRQRNTISPGPSHGKSAVLIDGGSRPRRGRGPGHRSGQPRPGAHACPHPGCGKSFQYLSKLRDHEHTHLPDKVYACTLGSCSKSFKRRRELKAHEKIIHPGHPSESEAGDQEMVDVGEVEPVEGQKKLSGRQDEDSKVGIEGDCSKESPPPKLRRPSNEISGVGIGGVSSSPPTPKNRGAATSGPERLSSVALEQTPSQALGQLPSQTPERLHNPGHKRLQPMEPEPEQRPSQPPVRLPPPDPSPTLPAMPEDTEPEKDPSPPLRESAPLTNKRNAEEHIEKLGVNLFRS